MSIISFCSEEEKETGQSLSLAAVASYMAIEHNYKTLIISTGFNDLSLENCFWEYDSIRDLGQVITPTKNTEIDNGIEGLIKVIASNRISNEIVKNYSKTVLRGDRLDVLLSPKTTGYDEYVEVARQYTKIIDIANRYYDLIFVDLSKKLPEDTKKEIKVKSDIVILNFAQKSKSIKQIEMLREKNEIYKKEKTILLVGKYDSFSKYNTKNITRYIKEKKEINAIPYNTLFFESCSEGNIIDFLLKVRNVTDEFDRNVNFLKEISRIDNNIVYKLQELQMKI